MNRITELFQRKPHEILNIYFTAGYPNLDDTASIVQALERSGADMVEIGMPYSDPLADGPTIQASSSRALTNGMNLPLLFEQLENLRPRTDLPIVLMGYLNPILQFGDEAFFRRCAELGVDSLIIPDLPMPDYEDHYRSLVEDLDLGFSFLITPQTSAERIRRVDELSRGFIYMVSNASITGAKNQISSAQIDYFRRIQRMDLRNPRLIGFGISSRETFTTACEFAQGAIIGSAFIKTLGDAGDSLEPAITRFVHTIRGIQVPIH